MPRRNSFALAVYHKEDGVFVIREYVGSICPLCNRPLKDGDRVSFCWDCGTPHHFTCWQENNGCAKPNCTATIRGSSTAGVTLADTDWEWDSARDDQPEVLPMKSQKKRKLPKGIKIAAIATLALAVVLIGCICLVQGIRHNRYQTACEHLENGQYDSAFSIFSSLGNYEDSANLANKALYHKAETALLDKQFDAAYEIFSNLGDYLDSATLASEALYQKATAALLDQQFDAAYEIFSNLGDYLDSATLANEALYQKAIAALLDKQFDAAYDIFSGLIGYKDSAGMVNETLYQQGIDLLEQGLYDRVVAVLEKIERYKDCAEIIAEALYRKADHCLENKDYVQAASTFQLITYYKDSRDKVKEAKYAYVLEHLNNDDTITYDYLTSLKKVSYKDCAAIYEELYSWEVTILGWKTSEESTVYATEISRFSPVYCHISIRGGAPNTSLAITYTYSLPDGRAYSNTGDEPWDDGSKGHIFWASGIYSNPAQGAIGTLFIYFYDEAGNLIGSGSVRITW